MIRSLISLTIVVTLVYCGATVELGERTFFGHVSRIWASEETQDLVDGVKTSGEPMLDKIGRGVKKGYEEATREPDPMTIDKLTVDTLAVDRTTVGRAIADQATVDTLAADEPTVDKRKQ